MEESHLFRLLAANKVLREFGKPHYSLPEERYLPEKARQSINDAASFARGVITKIRDYFSHSYK